MKRILLAACAVLALIGAVHARDVAPPKAMLSTWCKFAEDSWYLNSKCEGVTMTITRTGMRYSGSPEECTFTKFKWKSKGKDTRDNSYDVQVTCSTGCAYSCDVVYRLNETNHLDPVLYIRQIKP